jgi:diketogulonate reductase-like aldo/keto reductase
MNPLWQQKKLREFCKAKDIHITAFSPLGANGTKWGDNRIVECDILEEIAKAHGKTAAQVYMIFFLLKFDVLRHSIVETWMKLNIFVCFF